MVLNVLGYVLMGAGLLMAGLGVMGLFRFPVVYLRLLVSSNVDVVGMTLMMTGMMAISPNLLFAAKILLVLILSLITTPLTSHAVAASAYESGYRTK